MLSEYEDRAELDPNSWHEFQKRLEMLPRTRESVELLLDLLSSYDTIYEIYEKLLIDLNEHLTPDEILHLNKKLQKLFGVSIYNNMDLLFDDTK